MARWRLQLGHYLWTNPSEEVIFEETDRNTGRQARKVYKVPRFLDPKDGADHNYPGEIVVSNGNNAQGRDIIFIGDPTPDMEPVDEEAKKISQSFIDSGKWNRPEPGLDFGESLIKTFMDRMEKIQTNMQPVAVPAVAPDAFKALQDQVAALIEHNAKLQAQLLEKPGRRGL